MKIIVLIIPIIILYKLQHVPNLFMSFWTIMYLALAIVLDGFGIRVMMLYNEILNQIPIIYLVIIIFMIAPWILLKNFLKNIINIIYYKINKEKILAKGKNEKGEIQKIECVSRGFQNIYDIYNIIVDLNGKKIRSFYYLKREHEYKVGNKIDVIVYKNWKFVKIYNMQ